MKFISPYLERRKRRIEENYAHQHSYFWHPCPACGEPFGGHEVSDVGSFFDLTIIDPSNPAQRLIICPSCVRDGRGDPPESCPMVQWDVEG